MRWTGWRISHVRGENLAEDGNLLKTCNVDVLQVSPSQGLTPGKRERHRVSDDPKQEPQRCLVRLQKEKSAQGKGQDQDRNHDSHDWLDRIALTPVYQVSKGDR